MNTQPKTGDWVRVTDLEGTLGITKYIARLEDSPIFIQVEPWIPMENEWVIIKPKHPHMHKETSFNVRQYSHRTCKAFEVEPYLGELPSFIKD